MKRNPIWTIVQFELYENLRNRWLILYGFAFFALTSLILYFGGGRPLQAFASLLNVTLLLIPLFSMIFGGIVFSESVSFMELLLSREISRRDLFFGKWTGTALGLSLSYLFGSGLGSLLFLSGAGQGAQVYLELLLLGVPLHFVFISLSFMVSLLSRKKEVILGILLMLWFYFYIIYDLILMGLGVLLGDYPIELPLFILVLLNPVDLVRILLLLQLDLSSLMGFGAALFHRYLGPGGGMEMATLVLLLWSILPVLIAYRLFRRKDL